MKTLTLVLAVLLTGCATPPAFLANMYDSNDPCQNYYRVKDFKQPSWCGGGSGKRYVTRDYTTGRPLTTTRAQ